MNRYLFTEEDLKALSDATRDFGNASDRNFRERHEIMKQAEEKCRSVEVPSQATHFATKITGPDAADTPFNVSWIYREMPPEL